MGTFFSSHSLPWVKSPICHMSLGRVYFCQKHPNMLAESFFMCLLHCESQKGFGSKGKQHHKHTSSETQSHTHQMPRILMKYFQSSSDHPSIPASPMLTSVYLALHGNNVLFFTTHSANLYIEMRLIILGYFCASA